MNWKSQMLMAVVLSTMLLLPVGVGAMSMYFDLSWVSHPSVYALGEIQVSTVTVYNSGFNSDVVGTILLEVPSAMEFLGVTAQREDGSNFYVAYEEGAHGVIITSPAYLESEEVAYLNLTLQAKATSSSGFYYLRVTRMEGEADIHNNVLEVYLYEKNVTPCHLSLQDTGQLYAVSQNADRTLTFEVSKGQYSDPGVGEATLGLYGANPISTTLERSSSGIASINREPLQVLMELHDLMGLPPQANVGAIVSGTVPNVVWGDIIDPYRVETDPVDNHLVWFLDDWSLQEDEADIMVAGRRLSNNASDGRTRLSLVTGLSGGGVEIITATTVITSNCSWEIESGEVGDKPLQPGEFDEVVILLTLSPCDLHFTAVISGDVDVSNNLYAAVTPRIFMPLIMRH